MVKKSLNPTVKKMVDKEIDKKLRSIPEPKFVDAATTGFSIPVLPSFLSLTQIAQGVTPSQRVGNKVKVKSIDLKVKITGVNNSANPPMSTVRQVIFQDYNDNGTAPVGSDVFALPSQITSQINYLNLSQNKRFRILSDRFIPIGKYNSVSGFYDNTNVKIQHIRISGKKLSQVVFSGNSPTNYAKGQVWAVWYNDASGDLPLLEYDIRTVYTDL